MARVAVTFRLLEKLGPYEAALAQAGVETVRVHPDTAPASLQGFDGLVVTGGTDLNPALYGQERHALADEPDDARDAMELSLVREALAADVPVLAICRGMQLFNVAHGGTLVQHLDSVATHVVRPPAGELYRTAHRVTVAAGTRLAEIAGAGEHEVNSRHHQAVERLGDGLVITARAEDGVVEGVERPDRKFAVAVQWHPEDRVGVDPKDRALFAAFARAVER